MDWSKSWPPGLIERLGPLTAVSSLGGRAVRAVATASGVEVVVKRGPGVADEVAGLDRLAAVPGGPRVPSVLYHEDTLVALEWIESGPRRPAGEAALGRGLAALHAVPAGDWGGGSSWIGECRVDPAPGPSGAQFYGGRLSDLAARCGLEEPVGAVVERLPDLLPPGPPALLHGDLWWGNVLWGSGGEPALIDPSVHGGHPEEDLAMLALFGPVPGPVMAGYLERGPLESGWPDRVQLWQLYPLLVHSVLFGGSYRAEAERVARRYRG